LSEMSTRIWLDEQVWHKVRSRAVAEGTTVRELIPRLISQVLAELPTKAKPAAAPLVPVAPGAINANTESGPPTVPLSDVYRCGVCGGEVKVGGLTIHMGKHVKEQRANGAERS